MSSCRLIRTVELSAACGQLTAPHRIQRVAAALPAAGSAACWLGVRGGCPPRVSSPGDRGVRVRRRYSRTRSCASGSSARRPWRWPVGAAPQHRDTAFQVQRDRIRRGAATGAPAGGSTAAAASARSLPPELPGCRAAKPGRPGPPPAGSAPGGRVSTWPVTTPNRSISANPPPDATTSAGVRSLTAITTASGQSLLTCADWTWRDLLDPAGHGRGVDPDERSARVMPAARSTSACCAAGGPGDPHRADHQQARSEQCPDGCGQDGGRGQREERRLPRPARPRRRVIGPAADCGLFPGGVATPGRGHPRSCADVAFRPHLRSRQRARAAQRRSAGPSSVTSPAPMVSTRSPGLARPATTPGTAAAVRHEHGPGRREPRPRPSSR